MKIKYERTKQDVEKNNAVLAMPGTFVVYFSRKEISPEHTGYSGTFIVKDGREYNINSSKKQSKFNKHLKRNPHLSAFGRTVQEWIDDGFNLEYAGRPGDGKHHAWWNTELDLVDRMEF